MTPTGMKPKNRKPYNYVGSGKPKMSMNNSRSKMIDSVRKRFGSMRPKNFQF